jgi:NADH-quinone oxidoreductase subunit B
VGSERRPLSWVVGPQEVLRKKLPANRDLRRAARQKQGSLPSPYEL